MASVVIMPKQGLLMTQGTITQWLVNEGEPVKKGKPLFEMETDKLTICMDAEVDGTLLKIVHPVGDVVPITETIAIVGAPGEDISGLLNTLPSSDTDSKKEESVPVEEIHVDKEPAKKVLASPRAKLRAEENGLEISAINGTGPDGLIIERDVYHYIESQPAVTPLAANVAKTRGISLSAVTGTGVGGKITTADLVDSPPPVEIQNRGNRTEPMSSMRKAIARNMLASKSVNAQTDHRMVIDMSAVIDLRKQLNALGIKVSYNDIIVRVCAKALREYPIVNASVDGDNIVFHDYVNIGVAVSVPNGLIVPVIKDADLIGLNGIAAQSAELIQKARSGRLTEQDYHGGTFTVSSLGMFDLDDFVPIINPPEAAILGVGKISKTPVVITNASGEDEIVIRPICNLTLSFDHRIVDGAEAARFLQRVKLYLQTPALLI